MFLKPYPLRLFGAVAGHLETRAVALLNDPLALVPLVRNVAERRVC